MRTQKAVVRPAGVRFAATGMMVRRSNPVRTNVKSVVAVGYEACARGSW
jgi:hypothetical protein